MSFFGLECGICWHDFHHLHLENDRTEATVAEAQTNRCNDCIKCNPPEAAPVKEQHSQEIAR